jgi:hypothetical protein
MPKEIQDARLRGATVELARKLILDDAKESDWNTIAYEVALKGRGDVKLTRADFESAVRNFERYPRVPVVLQHADTDPGGHPDASKARGWITALRVGQMERNGKQVATLDAKYTLDEQTRADVNRDPPAWAYCSITIIKNATDEESGQRIGAVLYSLSLTNNPALQGLERIAASDERGLAATPQEISMNWLKLAAILGIAASTEQDAEAKILAHAEQLGDIRKALGLSASAAPTEVIAKLTATITEAAKVPGLEAKLAAAEKLESQRAERDRAAHIDALIQARPELAPVRASLEVHAKTDWAGFVKDNPLPSAAEQTERAQDEHRLERLTAPLRRELPEPRQDDSGAREIRACAYRVIAEARKQNIELSFPDAVDIVMGQSDDEPLDFADEDPALEGVR